MEPMTIRMAIVREKPDRRDVADVTRDLNVAERSVAGQSHLGLRRIWPDGAGVSNETLHFRHAGWRKKRERLAPLVLRIRSWRFHSQGCGVCRQSRCSRPFTRTLTL